MNRHCDFCGSEDIFGVTPSGDMSCYDCGDMIIETFNQVHNTDYPLPSEER